MNNSTMKLWFLLFTCCIQLPLISMYTVSVAAKNECSSTADSVAAAVIQKYVNEFIASEQAKAVSAKQQLQAVAVDTTVEVAQQSLVITAQASADTVAPTILNAPKPSDEKNKKVVENKKAIDRSLLKLAVAAFCVYGIVFLFS